MSMQFRFFGRTQTVVDILREDDRRFQFFACTLASRCKIDRGAKDRKLSLQIAAYIPTKDRSRAESNANPHRLSGDHLLGSPVNHLLCASKCLGCLVGIFKRKAPYAHDRVADELVYIGVVMKQDLDHLVEILPHLAREFIRWHGQTRRRKSAHVGEEDDAFNEPGFAVILA